MSYVGTFINIYSHFLRILYIKNYQNLYIFGGTIQKRRTFTYSLDVLVLYCTQNSANWHFLCSYETTKNEDKVAIDETLFLYLLTTIMLRKFHI